MLGGLALKRLWQQRRKAAGKPADKPNIVMGINVQICWEKFANYWDVEMRLVPMEGNRFTLSAEEAVKLCDENTIGVVAILGSTFDGSYEPVAEICAALDDLQERTGLNVPVHVDGASGAFIAPFVDPDLEWDFRLPRVSSINASGHKYGLVYPGVGWIVWRDADALPPDLIFWVNYLGDNMPTFALNFSRPGAQVVAQYYTFLRLGFDGYHTVQSYAREVATRLSGKIAELGPFELITHGDQLPVFAFKVKDEVDNFTAFDVSTSLRERGWQVPAYTFPANRTDLAALRVVVRQGVQPRPRRPAHQRPQAAAAAAAEAAGARSRRRRAELPPLTCAACSDSRRARTGCTRASGCWRRRTASWRRAIATPTAPGSPSTSPTASRCSTRSRWPRSRTAVSPWRRATSARRPSWCTSGTRRRAALRVGTRTRSRWMGE